MKEYTKSMIEVIEITAEDAVLTSGQGSIPGCEQTPEVDPFS